MTITRCLCHLDETIIILPRRCISCFLGIQKSTFSDDDDNDDNKERKTTDHQAMSSTPDNSISTVSLMVGDVPTNTASDTLQSENETSIHAEKATPPESPVGEESSVSKEEEDQIAEEAEEAVEDLKRAIQTAWEEEPEMTIIGTNNREECAAVLEKMLADRSHLERILIARKYRIEACVSLFFEQLRFRAKWKPESIQPEDIPNALPSGAWRLAGYTKEGIMVSNYKLRYWKPSKLGSSTKENSQGDGLDDAVDEYTNYVVYMIESMIANMKAPPTPQKFVVLFDLKGFTPSLVFRKDVRLMIRKLIYVAQSQYPERLHRTLLVNAPFGFESAWRLIKPLLDEKTAAKIHFVHLDTLTREIDADVLSKEYGGNHEEYPLPSA